MTDEIVGHKTFRDGKGGYRHEPLRKSEADALWAKCEADKAKRAQVMPDEESARRMLWDAQERLKELGWKEAMYCPKDGQMFEVIEPGSTGVHKCNYDGEWPTGSYWVHSEGGLWPSRPLLFRPLPSNDQVQR